MGTSTVTHGFRCQYCNAKTHSTDWCPHTWSGHARRMRGDKLLCKYCHSDKHNTDACPKKWPGDRPSFHE